MMWRNLAILLFTALLLGSCTAELNNRYDAMALECGEIERSPDANILLIRDPLDANLRERVQWLKAAIWHNTTWQELKVSRGACISIPKGSDGLLIVEDPSHDQAASLNLRAQESLPTRLELTLRKPSTFKFRCPEQGLAADQMLKLDITSRSSDVSQAGMVLRWRAETFDGSANENHPIELLKLWNGSETSAEALELDLRGLREGRYRLHVQAGYLHPNQSPDELPRLSEDQGCLLQIIRSQPQIPRFVDAVVSSAGIAEVFQAVGKPVAIAKDPDSSLESCYETAPADKSCRANHCADPQAFRSSDTLELPKTGKFVVFVRARDRAQHLSATACSLVKVSGTAPRLTLQWQRNISQDFPIAPFAPLQIRAQVVELSHEILDRDELESQLECNLTWTSSLGNTRNGRYSRCLNGACSGKTFQGWMPCSAAIAIDISQEWLQTENAESFLTLSVRANDHNGHVSIAKQSLWYSAQTLQAQNFPELGPTQNNGDTVLFTLDQQIYAAIDNRLHAIDANGKASEAMDSQFERALGNRQVKSSKFIKDLRGDTLWVLWYLVGNEQLFGRWQQGRWLFSTESPDLWPDKPCDAFEQSSQGQLFCLSKEKLLIRNSNGSWSESTLPLGPTGASACPSYLVRPGSYTELGNERWYVCTYKRILHQVIGENSWKSLPADPVLNAIGYQEVFADADKRLWMLGRDKDYAWQVFVRDDKGWRETSGPFRQYQDDFLHFQVDEVGDLHLGSTRFDKLSQQWQALLPMNKSSDVMTDQQGGRWIVAEDKALVRLQPDPLIIPFEQIGVRPGSQITSIHAKDRDIWLTLSQSLSGFALSGSSGVWHVTARDWQSFAYTYVRTPSFGQEWIKAVSIDSQGLAMFRRDGEIAKLARDEGWVTLSISSERPEDLTKLSDMKWLKDDQLLLSGNRKLWLWNQTGFHEVKLGDFPLSSILRDSVVDADGTLWYWFQSGSANGQLYQLKEGHWKAVTIEGLPSRCGKLLSVARDHQLLLQCQSDHYLITGDQARPLSQFVSAVHSGSRLLKVDSPRSPYVFMSYHEEDQQYVQRCDLQSKNCQSWLIPLENRLMIRNDETSDDILIDQIVIDPTQVERFLVQITGHVLRAEQDKLIVATSRQTVARDKGVISDHSTMDLGLVSIGRHGEVWILADDLGLIRYDRIWQAVDPEL